MTMNKKKTGITLLIIGVLLTIGTYFLSSHMEDITITEQAIQTKINDAMPFTVKKLAGTVTVSSAQVAIDKQATVDMNGSATILGKTTEFQAHVIGSIIYKEGAFYFDPADIQMVYGKTMTDEVNHPVASKFANFALKKSKELGFSNEDLKNIATKHITEKLHTIPVYKLKPGMLRASLKDVIFTKGEIHINMSLLELAKSALFGLVIAIGALAFGIALVSTGGSFLIGGVLLS